MRRILLLIVGLLALAPGVVLLQHLGDWPWHAVRALAPRYAAGPHDLLLAAWTSLSGLAALGVFALARRRGVRALTALAAAGCVGLGLWALFPADLRQVAPRAALGLGLAATLCLTAALHGLSCGAAGRGLLALWSRVLALPRAVFLPLTGGLAAVIAAALALGLFGGAPVISDGRCYLYLAHLLLEGQVTGPATVPADLASMVQLPLTGGDTAWFIQHPPGFPVLLALGVAIGLPWIINPLLQGLLVAALYRLGREVRGEAVGRGAALLGVVAPFLQLYAAMHMAHTATLVALTGFAAAALACRRRGWFAPLAAGMLLGVAATMRPWSALLYALPFAVSGGMRLVRRPRRYGWRLLLGLAGLAPPLALLLLYNRAITGSPFAFGYHAIHGSGHALGFGTRGFVGALEPFTPWMGLAQTQFRLGLVQEALLGWPLPLLLLVACAFGRGTGRPERLLLASLVTVAVGYGCYFNRGDWLVDPRFLLAGCPGLLVLTALALARLRESPLRLSPRVAATALAVLAVVALGWRAPEQVRDLAGWLMRDRVRVDPAVALLAGERAILLLDDAAFEAVGQLAVDPHLERPLVTARASGRADDDFRKFFPDRPGCYYLARGPVGPVLYREVARRDGCAQQRGLVAAGRLSLEWLGRSNRGWVIRQGVPACREITAGAGEALAFGWIRRGDPGKSTLVVKLGGRVVWRRDLQPIGKWMFRDGFVPLPPGRHELRFEVEGPARVGILNPDRIQAELHPRYRPGLAPGGRPSLQ